MKNVDKPNILIFLTDQQSSTMMSCAGNPYVSTPAIDNLANNGVRFSNCVCSNPVCVPSRFSLFTGKRPSEINMKCNEDARTIQKVNRSILDNGMGHLLRNAGYETLYGGKEHLPTFRAKDIGFEYFCRNERGELAKEASNLLRKQHKEPFCMVVSFINPHDVCYMAIESHRTHLNVQRRFLGAFLEKLRMKKRKLELRNVYSIMDNIDADTGLNELPPLPKNHEPQENEPEAVRSLFKRQFRGYARRKWNEKDWRIHRYVYARLTEKVDNEIGKVLNALDNGPNTDNTVVIFTSDHGDHDASHKLEHKTALYKEAVKVPFIIQWKEKLPSMVENQQAISNGLDLLPTICDIAGISAPENLEGQSILRFTEHNGGVENIEERWLPVESEIGRSIWSSEWVYCLYDFGEHKEQLYNLKTEPQQQKNLIHDNPNILKKCREIFKKFW